MFIVKFFVHPLIYETESLGMKGRYYEVLLGRV